MGISTLIITFVIGFTLGGFTVKEILKRALLRMEENGEIKVLK